MTVLPFPSTALCGHPVPGDRPICDSCLEETIGGDLLSRAGRIAPLDAPLLVQGETGTGKTLLAEYIHRISPRAAGPFQKRGCGDFPASTAAAALFGMVAGAFTDARDRAGILERTDEGTLILDDIDYMPLELQQALLRFLDDGVFYRVGETHVPRQARVRIIATTNKDLVRLAAEQRFLPDLLARLLRFVLRLPPLRDRAAAIPRIATIVLEDAARRAGRPPETWTLAPDARRLAQDLPWRRNVRELQAAVEHLTVFVRPEGGAITAADLRAALRELEGTPLPADTAPPPPPDPHRSLHEQIYRALSESGGSVARAARTVGCSRTTVYKHLRSYRWPQ